MRITKRGEFRDLVEYRLFFAHHAFDCDANGRVDLAALAKRPEALAAYQTCLACGPGRVERYARTVREPAEGRCACGELVILDDSWLNACDCGRDYNGSGQELAPRDQWGEETDEHPADVARGGDL